MQELLADFTDPQFTSNKRLSNHKDVTLMALLDS